MAFDYEVERIPYVLECEYVTDFILRTKSGKKVVIEYKGWPDDSDRRLLSQVKKQYPDLDLRMVMDRASTLDSPLRKGGKLTVRGWCAKHGIPVAAEILPEEWILE